jgi:hypothetical protein
MSFVGIGQSGSGNPAPNAHVVELAVDRSQAGFDITQALAIGQLSKCDAKELIQTRKSPEFMVTPVALDALVELVGWDVIDQLREDDADSDDVDQSFRGDGDQRGAKRREAFSV